MKSALFLLSLVSLSTARYLGTRTNNTVLPTGINVFPPLQTVRNELIDGPCKKVTIIFGRGATQPGNVGLLVGPSFFSAVAAIISSANIAVQGVDYAATDLAALLGGSTYGAATVASLANLAASKCPGSQIVLSGYSEGAEIIHRAGQNLSNVTSSIKAVVVFGDLMNGQPIANVHASAVKSFCAFGDVLCGQPSIIMPGAHTSYDDVTPEAADFVKEKLSV
ncbi:cutinase-domain-containing protein [Mytilinidion resinicola]|uniref:cutinase n=1 Tax=Mytilinidion resinicola TaxID=574789 RepID=A0A6A6YTC2_9PEZI|nr:cutinase-domain-containing protein [Mytilinidion resinicola]KAF2812172.1 cutinase-domain-containing protein [Mytilinidion resinicola]